MRSVMGLGRGIVTWQETYLIASDADDYEELGHGGVICVERLRGNWMKWMKWFIKEVVL